MTWLTTGGAGYIGAHVVQETLKSGRDLVVLDDLSSGVAARLPSGIDIERVTLTDGNSVESVFARHNFIGVLHLAAKKKVGESVERPEYYWRENVGVFQNLVAAMKSHGVKNLVFSSSTVGDDAFPYPEDSRWAQPEIQFAANAMRELNLDSDRCKQIGDRARAEVLAEFTMEHAAEFTRIRVEYLHKRHFFKRLLKAFRKW
jgi:UDP-glucose 4-epimerase